MRINYITSILIVTILIAVSCNSNKRIKKIACVGDSITYGHGIDSREQNSYPAQLKQIIGDNFDVVNFGVSGTTMLKNGDLPYYKQQEYDSALAFNPDILIIMLGSNDSKPWNWNKKDEYLNDYISLIDSFQELQSNPEIWVCIPPPAFKIKWGINDSIIRKDIAPLISDIAIKEDIRVIDLYTPFIDKDEYFPDFIHPDSTGASLIAQKIANTVISN